MSTAGGAASDELRARLSELQRPVQQQLAHAWMVRAFIRHSAEFEDYPELNDIARAIFDIARAMDAKLEDPYGYFRMLNKKLGKFRKEVEQYAAALGHISEHTNFLMSVVSLQGVILQLTAIQQSLPPLTAAASGAQTPAPDEDDESDPAAAGSSGTG